ncbi:hypothetical protein QJS10_CPA06g00440 [Acorus calamus]|uniref:Rubisco LSMT substrate-binding domain-containing protein n=1 Tax=Acorus calamus TaxID=4465 RepID=A0AAV9EJN1_ACOCL|nr:hypothetical protein QJS10_CPA06g00440 [Acorus calamus]
MASLHSLGRTSAVWRWLSENKATPASSTLVKPAAVLEGRRLVAQRDISPREKLWINPDTVAASDIGGIWAPKSGRPKLLSLSSSPERKEGPTLPRVLPIMQGVDKATTGKKFYKLHRLKGNEMLQLEFQVYIQYDLDKSNAEMALEFGLVESRPDRGVYTLMLDVPKSDPFYGDKVDIFESEGLKGTKYFDIVLGQALPHDMLPYLRLVALGGTDAFLLEESMFRNSIWGHLELPVSRANEELICLVIRDACKSALSVYHTTIAKLRESGNLSPRLEIAIGVREGEKKVLQQIDDIFKDRATQLDVLYYQERKDQRSGTGL